MSDPRFVAAQLDEIPPTPCPCGQARRAFQEAWNTLATVHLTDIHADSRAHYHQKMTEIYIVLEGEGYLEADGEIVPLKPMTAVMIQIDFPQSTWVAMQPEVAGGEVVIFTHSY